MSHSRLLVVLGTGSRYSGQGLQPDALMSFYDDKGVWVLQTGAGGHRLFTEPEFCIDDALLMVTGLHLARAGAVGGGCAAVRNKLPEFFTLEGSARDWSDSCLSLARRPLNRSDWQSLYRESGHVLAEINLKMIWVLLARGLTEAGRRLIPGVATIQERLQAHGLKNYEICTPCAGNSYGDFDAP